MILYYIATRMAEIKMTDNNKCWLKWGTTVTLRTSTRTVSHCMWDNVDDSFRHSNKWRKSETVPVYMKKPAKLRDEYSDYLCR